MYRGLLPSSRTLANSCAHYFEASYISSLKITKNFLISFISR